jgi:hypothetical protein
MELIGLASRAAHTPHVNPTSTPVPGLTPCPATSSPATQTLSLSWCRAGVRQAVDGGGCFHWLVRDAGAWARHRLTCGIRCLILGPYGFCAGWVVWS